MTHATAWIHVIGLGDEGLEGLSPLARSALDQAKAVFGGPRHLSLLGAADTRPRHAWPSPFAIPTEVMQRYAPGPIAVLASGDPSHSGPGKALLRHFPVAALSVFPAPSAFSLAAARLGWSLEDTLSISLHGRPLSHLSAVLAPKAKILALGVDSTATQVAALLRQAGLGPSRITALSHMGGIWETRLDGTADAWPTQSLPSLTTLAIECSPGPGYQPLPYTPGLPDQAFEHDGQLTKRDIRALTLSRLAPRPGQLLWDVGAGCGSVSIEWLRAGRDLRAIAIEHHPQRLRMITRNALALGADQLHVINGRAPEALSNLETPDAIFIGGGVSDTAIMQACWQALRPGGRLVANAVTLAGEANLLDFASTHGAENSISLTRLQLAEAQPLGGHLCWRPALPITQLCADKALAL